MPPKRERFNAKARQSVAGGSHSHKGKRGKRPRIEENENGAADGSTGAPSSAVVDTNAPIIEDKDRRAQKMMQEMVAQTRTESSKPMSAKKRKRFEAYVAKQLKKEDRVRLLSSLAETSADVADRGKLISASTLGSTRGGLTNDERAQKLARKGDGKARRRRAAAFQVEEGDEDADLDRSSADEEDDDEDQGAAGPSVPANKKAVQAALESGPTGEVNEDAERRARIEAATRAYTETAAAAGAASSAPAPARPAVQIGYALAKGADGQALPLASMPMRKRKRKTKAERASDGQRSTARSRLRASGTSWGKVVAEDQDDEEDESSDFDSSASSSSSDAEEEPAPPTRRLDKGKGRAVENEEPQAAGASDGESGASDEEMEEKIDRAVLDAMRARGLDPAQLGFGGGRDDDGAESSGSSASSSPSAARSQAPGESTDEEMEEERDAAIVAELRRRGLDPKKYGFDAESESESESDSEAAGPAARGALDASEGVNGERADSPPWEGFGSDDEAKPGAEESEESDSEDEEDGSEEEDEDQDEDDEEEPPDHPSRRRGVQKTVRSSGFKDWARGALGLNGSTKEAEGANDEDGSVLQPVAGLKVRVGDLGPQDGIARGPLGQDEPTAEQMSAFAAKHYAELKERKASGGAQAFTSHVEVKRSKELQEARLKLPVVAEEEHIVKTILENPVTVICGETGSGKTTQVPQFLYERGFGTPGSQNPGMIGITQPRRVAALSMAQRVASELSLPPNKVSHQIRYDVTVSPSTSIKFMTDGVLLRELATDFLLSKYSLIVIDEAHERSVNTDILIGLLTRIVRLREKRWLEGGATDIRPLRLVIMSATLRVSDFADNAALFPPPAPRPPIIEIGARQHPVTVHFNRRTVHDYIAESVTKVSKIHARLPPGGILVFLTGQQEITTVCKRLEQRYGRRAIERKREAKSRAAARLQAAEDDPQPASAPVSGVEPEAEELDLGVDADRDLAADVDDGAAVQQDDEALDTDDEDAAAHDDDLPEELRDDSDVPMHILPLYSLLPSDKQMRVFEEPPADSRLVVVATNVAETSLTIPNIRYVVDCGRAKERSFDAASGIQNFNVSWISKASAAQRAGRAGRTGPGHCYRLYSSAVYEDHFEQFSEPEILRTPIEGLVLQMKAMNIIQVAGFPFPTCPERSTLVRAERTLTHLNALELAETKSANGRTSQAARITELGRVMTHFPLSPRFAKLLVQGRQHGCLPFVIALVAALSVGDPFVREEALQDDDDDGSDEEAGNAAGDDYDKAINAGLLNSEKARQKREAQAQRKRFFGAMSRFSALGAGFSDVFRLLSAVGAYEHAGGSKAFCEAHFLRPKAMEEIHKLRAQLSNLVVANLDGLTPAECAAILDPKLALPDETQLKVLRQLVAAAFVDQVAVRADLVDTTDAAGHAVRSYAKMKSTRHVPYRAMGVGSELAYIHPSSTLFHGPPPEWIVFTEIQRSKSKAVTVQGAGGDAETVLQPGRPMLRGVTKINPAWLATLGRSLCSFDKPLDASGAPASAAPDLATLARAKAAAASAGAAAPAANGSSKKGSKGDAPGEITRDVLIVPRYAAAADCGAVQGGLGWELPPIKAKQRLVQGRWVTIV